MKRNLSIIIATYNRRDIVLKALEAYKRQTAANEILEVVVVDDGSTDGTRQAVPQSSLASPFAVRYLRQGHGGQAKARNRAILESKGELVLMGDDDIIPAPALVAEHLAWHEKFPALPDAVVGRVVWAPDLNPTPFMEWLAQDGMFSFGRMCRGLLDKPVFYSGNISLKRDFLMRNGLFDEEFRTYGFEDMELGYRLAKKGLRVFYSPEAVGYHHKKLLVADVERWAEEVEAARPFFLAKIGAGSDPDPFEADSGTKRALRNLVRDILPLAAPVLRLFDTQIPLPWTVYRLFYFHYILPTVRAKGYARRGGLQQISPDTWDA